MSGSSHITVLCGGPSAERDVSLISGKAVAETLAQNFAVTLHEMEGRELPESLDPAATAIFPALHGTFGEDGELQALLEARGLAYAGSGPAASALCMHKIETKAVAADCGFAEAADLTFLAAEAPGEDEIIDALGLPLVLKPVDQGSSVGLHIIESEAQLARELMRLPEGKWMTEAFIRGREMTVGILDGEAMGIVEIVPAGGLYDYQHKYTAGATEYFFPAELPEALAADCRLAAERAFAACGCRDFARVDFILDGDRPCLLEINTIPGLTPTSLLPKSAACVGLDFIELARRMAAPALLRMNNPQPL